MSSGYDWERVLGQSSDAVKEEDAALDKGRSWWPFARKQAAGEHADPADDESMAGAEPDEPESGPGTPPVTAGEPATAVPDGAGGPVQAAAAADAGAPSTGAEPKAAAPAEPGTETAPVEQTVSGAVPKTDSPEPAVPASAAAQPETEAATTQPDVEPTASQADEPMAGAEANEPAAATEQEAAGAASARSEAGLDAGSAGAAAEAAGLEAAGSDKPVASEAPGSDHAPVAEAAESDAVTAAEHPADPVSAEADPVAEAQEEPVSAESDLVAEAQEEPVSAESDLVAEAQEEPVSAESDLVAEAQDEPVSAESDLVAEAQEEPISAEAGLVAEALEEPVSAEAGLVAEAQEDPVSAEADLVAEDPEEPVSADAGLVAEAQEEPVSAEADLVAEAQDEPVSAEADLVVEAQDEPVSAEADLVAEAQEEPVSAEAGLVAEAQEEPVMAEAGAEAPTFALKLQSDTQDGAEVSEGDVPTTEVAALEAVETAADEAAETEADLAEAEPAAEPELVAEIEECTLMAQDEEAVELSLYTGQDSKDHVPAVFARANTDETHMPAPVPRELIEPTAHEERYKAFGDEEDDYVPAALRKSERERDGLESKYFVGDDLQAPAYNTNQEDSRPLNDVHLDDILREAVERRASDIHLTTGLPPMVRVDGEVVPLSYEITTPDQAQRLLYEILSDDNLEKFEQKHELDFGYTVKGLARFRVNVYMQRGSVAAALRMIPNRIPTYDELRLPTTIRDIAKRSSGLILVTGPTGSGKSTSIAAMIDDINETRQGHILTIEDPIEYLHRHKRCMVNQREMHADTYSFHNALRAVLREDPDIILVGELRDLETIEAALTLAETGHLVFGTLHTRNAPSTIDRVVDVFPADQQDQIRVLLANTIEGIISQQLLPKLGGGRVAALEIMTGIAAVKNLIREGKTHQMYSVIETSKNMGMVTMDASLAELFRGGYVSYDECLLRAVDKDTFARLAKNAA